MKYTLVILMVLSSMGIFAKESKEQKFWSWFVKNEHIIFQFENNKEKVMDSLSNKLSGFREGLTYEISTIENGKREFIVSGDGIKDNFPSVIKLTNAAPELDRWVIIPFRPRQNDYINFILNYDDKEFDPKKLWIYYRIEEGKFDLIIYYPDYSEEKRNDFIGGAYILLDMALGEFDVTTGVRYIDHLRLPENPEVEGLLPFSELRRVYDEYKEKFG